MSQRIYWGGFFHDGGIAALLVAAVQAAAAMIAHTGLPAGHLLGLVAPQIVISMLLVPLFLRLTGQFDNFLLKRRSFALMPRSKPPITEAWRGIPFTRPPIFRARERQRSLWGKRL